MKENMNLIYLIQMKKEFLDKDIINNAKFKEFNQKHKYF